MKHTKKGSAVIEAAVIIPLFIIAILTIGYTIKTIDGSCSVMHSLYDEARYMQCYAYENDLGAAYIAKIKLRGNNVDEIDDFSIKKFNYLYDDGYIRVDTAFKVENQLPICLHKDFKLKEGVLLRGFVAHSNEGEVYSFEKMQLEDEDSTVWIFPHAGEKYHKESCSYINVYPRQVILTDEVRKEYSPCKLCKPDEYANGHVVYIFKTGKVYHSGNCTSVDRYVCSMSKKEAVEKGYKACLKCGG